MENGERSTRREWLATCAGAAGASVLAGCQGSGSSDSGNSSGPGGSSVSSGSTDIAPEGWPMRGGDPANTRNRPEATGPADEPEIVWEATTDQTARFAAEAAVVDGTVYIAGGDDVVRAFDGETGESRWEMALDTYGLSTPLVVDDTVYVGSGETLFALDRSDGTVRWTEEIDRGLDARLSYYDGDIYTRAEIGDDEENVVIKFDPENREGERLAEFETGNITGTPAIANDTLYVTSETGVYAVDVGGGSAQWEFDTEDVSVTTVPPTVADGTVYAIAAGEEDDVGTENSHLLAIDASSGEELWRYSNESAHGFHQTDSSAVQKTLAVADGTVYLPVNYLQAIDAETGEQRWESSGGNSSPAVIDGVVYGTMSDRVVAVDPSDGSILWESEELSGMFGSGTVVSGGHVYQTAGYGEFYALG